VIRPDRYALYERAVQTPEHDVELIARIYRERRRRAPRTLREDFAGTAAVSIAWVASDDEREAIAIDLDAGALSRARVNAKARLETDERARLSLVRGDVRTVATRAVDVVLAPNFSWAILDDLGAYLGAVRRSLASGGLLLLETFGGRDLERRIVHRHERPGFTYVWEHRGFDPVSRVLDARIHFEARGRMLRDAFSYRFRLRTLAELRALLRDAGLARADLLVEDARGALRPVSRAPPRAAWNGYLVASVR
jgi:hypothetical protein